MTAWSIALIAVAGGVGAVVRLLVDSTVTAAVVARWKRPFPLGTIVVNVSGSFAIGLVAGAAAASALPAEVAVVLGTGLLGGYTTFSAASVDALRLAREGRRAAALAYAVGGVVSSTIAAAAGLVLATLGLTAL